MTALPEMWTWRSVSNQSYSDYAYDHDTWNPAHDNIANAGIGLGLYFTFVHFRVPEWGAILLTLILNTMWQVKNGLVPGITKTGGNRYFGAWGYSFIGQIYCVGGVLIAFLVDVMWPPAIQPSRSGESYEELEGDEDMTF